MQHACFFASILQVANSANSLGLHVHISHGNAGNFLLFDTFDRAYKGVV